MSRRDLRPGHLAARFATSFGGRPPSAPDLAWATSILTDAELPFLRRLAPHDQRHAIATARRVDGALDAAEPDRDALVAAALLHDTGKFDAALGIVGRAMASIPMVLLGRERVAAWHGGRGPRGWAGTYAAHGPLGAAALGAAGARPAVVEWAAAHHAPERFGSLSIPRMVVGVLDRADRA